MSAEILPFKKQKGWPWQAVKTVPYLKLNLESGIYFVRKYKAGKGELFKSTGQKTKGTALTVADDMIAEWLGGRKKTTGKRKTIADIIPELDRHLEAEFQNGDRRPITRKHDKNYLPLIGKLFGERFADEIDEEFWEDWVKFTGKKLGRETLFDIAKKLSKCLTFAYERKYIQRKPRIRNPDKQRKTGRIYTDEEISILVSVSDPVTLSQIALGYESGLRSYEVRCLRKDWLQFTSPDAGILTLPEDFVKANARTIQLSPGSSKLIWERIQAGPEKSPFIYPSATRPLLYCETPVYQNRRWHKIVRAANTELVKQGKSPITGRVWFKYLRHSFYNKALLELGLPIQQVSAYGGTSIQTLQKRYLLNDPNRTAVVGRAISISAVRGKFVGLKDNRNGSR